MAQIYKAVSFTTFHHNPDNNYGWLYMRVGEDVTSCKIDHQAAVKMVYQLARKLGKPVEMYNNRFNPTISSVEINGFLP